MSVSSKLISALDSIIYAFKSGVKSSLKDYSDLETILNPTTLVAKDGSMATIYEIYGSKSYVGEEEVLLLEEQLYSTLKSSLQKEGHQIQFVFSKDKDKVRDYIETTLSQARKSARNQQLDLDYYFDSKVEHLTKFCAYESCFMVVWSKPELIKETLKEQQQENAERAAKAPLFIDAQNIIMEYDRLESNHSAICSTIETAFDLAGVNIERLNVRKAVKEVRKSINYKNTSPDWEPSLPMLLDEDSDVPISIPMSEGKSLRQSETDVSGLLWSSISEQIFPVAIDIHDSNIIKMGETYISSLYMEIPPQNVSPFKNLLDSLDDDIPLQMSFTLESGGLNKAKMKAMAASILAVTNAGNKMVRDSINALKDMELSGDSIVKLSVNAITWADNVKELNLRKQNLNKKLQSWGDAQIAFNNVDPVEGFVFAQPAVTKKTSGFAALAPLSDIIKMLPLTRQSHVWEKGSVLFRTYDGKVFPFQPGSSLQNTWNYLIFAKPGSGKSVLMNAMNLAAITQPGMNELPFIGAIDIGPSSAGLIQLIKDALPEQLKHLAIYERIQNTSNYAINIFDTVLGSRYPTPSDSAFLKNILTLLMTPAGKSDPYESTDALVSKIVAKAYERYADTVDSTPKRYRRGYDKEVDDKLKVLGIDAENDDLCWWNIVDLFFKNQENRLAGKAQRFAVPIMEDLIDVATSTASISTTYSKPVAKTGETMIDLFTRSITEAISQYPMLSLPTVFDISESRIISLDLDEVTKGDDPTAVKQNAIMFMLGRYVVGRNFKISKEEIQNTFKLDETSSDFYNVKDDLMKFHMERAKQNRQTKKILCIDEFHRTEGVSAIRNQVKTDQREGRKWNLQVVLASQLMEDFSNDMRKLATGVFILSGGTVSGELSEMFDLNPTTTEIVRSRLNGPTKKGSPFIFNVETNDGAYSQYLFSTLSPVEIWSLTTTAEDSTLKDRLTEELGSPKDARVILAKAFPNGSAKARIEKIVSTTSDPKIMRDPYSYLVDKLKAKFDLF